MAGTWNTWSNGGLGDYVHLRAWRYQVYGINRNFGNSESFLSSAISAYNDARAIAQRVAVKDGAAQEVENYYNAILGQQWNSTAFTSYSNLSVADMEEAEQALAVSMLETFEKDLVQINRNNLSPSINKSNQFDSISYSGLQKKGQLSAYTTTIKGIIAKADSIIQIVGKQIKNNSRGLSEEALQKLIMNFEAFRGLKEELDESIRRHYEGKGYVPIRSAANKYNFLGELIKELVYYSKKLAVPTQREAGQAGELFGSYGAVAADRKIEKITAEMIKKHVVGSSKQGSYIELGISSFIDASTVLNELNSKTVGGEKAKWTLSGGGIVSGSTYADTVDVSITFGDSDNVFGVQDLGLSIKNYFDPTNSLGRNRDISIIKETPLLFVLNLLNSNFSNHYLNLLVGSGSSNNFNIANNVIKYGLAVRGLSGARTASFGKLAQYFIVNSQYQKHIYVFSTAELIDRLNPAPGLFDDSLAKVTGLPSFGALKSSNYYHETVEQRLAQLIVDTHSFKLSMSLASGIFNS